MSRVKRVFIVIAVLAATLVIDFMLTGWGTFPQDRAKSALTTQLDDFKQTGECILTENGYINFDEMGAITQEEREAWLEDFSYDTGSYSLNAESTECTYTVEISSKQVAEAITKNFDILKTYYVELAQDNTDHDKIQSEINDTIYTEVMAEDATTTMVDVRLIYQDDEWVISNEGQLDLANAILGDVDNIESTLQSVVNASIASGTIL